MKHEVIGFVMVFTLLEDFIFFQFNLKFLICFLIFFFKWWTISVPRKTLLNKRVVLSFRERTAFLQGAGSEDLDHIFKVWTVILGCWAQPIASPDPPQGNAALTTSISDCRRSRH